MEGGNEEGGEKRELRVWKESSCDCSFIGQPNPEDTNQRTGPPEDAPFSSLTPRLRQSPLDSTLFTRAKLSHCVGFGAGRAVDNVVRHLLLFIISMY